MFKQIQNLLKRKPKESYDSIYNTTKGGFTIWAEEGSSCSEGHLFISLDVPQEEVDLIVMRYVYNFCKSRNYTLEHTLEQIESNLALNRL